MIKETLLRKVALLAFSELKNNIRFDKEIKS